MQKFIKIYLFKFVTLNAQNAQCGQTFSVIVDLSLFLMLLSLEKDLSPEQLVTILS